MLVKDATLGEETAGAGELLLSLDGVFIDFKTEVVLELETAAAGRVRCFGTTGVRVVTEVVAVAGEVLEVFKMEVWVE